MSPEFTAVGVVGSGGDDAGVRAVGVVVEAVGTEEDMLVDLRLSERERQERPRRVPLRLAQRRRRRHCRASPTLAGL